MKLNKFAPLFSVAIALFAVLSVFAQSDKFSDPNVDYSFDIPDAKWKMTVKPSATSPNVEYVFVDRNDGHLEVRKLTVAKDSTLSDIVRGEEQKLQFLPGYVTGKQEPFAGKLKGGILNYEFVRAGHNMSGRFYFLRADENTVYLLRFAGERDKLKSIRNQTDSIARTLEFKKG